MKQIPEWKPTNLISDDEREMFVPNLLREIAELKKENATLKKLTEITNVWDEIEIPPATIETKMMRDDVWHNLYSEDQLKFTAVRTRRHTLKQALNIVYNASSLIDAHDSIRKLIKGYQ